MLVFASTVQTFKARRAYIIHNSNFKVLNVLCLFHVFQKHVLAGELALLAKCLPCEREDVSLAPSKIYIKKSQARQRVARVPVKTEGCLRLTGHQSSQTGGRPCLEK